MSNRALALLVTVGLVATAPAYADPLADVVRAQLLAVMPAGADVAKVHLPAKLATLDLEPSHVAVEIPRELRVGRRSIKVAIRGRRAVFVPVTIGAVVEVAIASRALSPGETIAAHDVQIESRAVDQGAPVSPRAVIGATVTRAIAAGAFVMTGEVTLPPPVPRGTHVTVVLQRGAVRVRGTGTLELVARPGETATVRLAHNKTIVRGTFVPPSTVVVGDLP